MIVNVQVVSFTLAVSLLPTVTSGSVDANTNVCAPRSIQSHQPIQAIQHKERATGKPSQVKQSKRMRGSQTTNSSEIAPWGWYMDVDVGKIGGPGRKRKCPVSPRTVVDGERGERSSRQTEQQGQLILSKVSHLASSPKAQPRPLPPPVRLLTASSACCLVKRCLWSSWMARSIRSASAREEPSLMCSRTARSNFVAMTAASCPE